MAFGIAVSDGDGDGDKAAATLGTARHPHIRYVYQYICLGLHFKKPFISKTQRPTSLHPAYQTVHLPPRRHAVLMCV